MTSSDKWNDRYWSPFKVIIERDYESPIIRKRLALFSHKAVTVTDAVAAYGCVTHGIPLMTPALLPKTANLLFFERKGN